MVLFIMNCSGFVCLFRCMVMVGCIVCIYIGSICFGVVVVGVIGVVGMVVVVVVNSGSRVGCMGNCCGKEVLLICIVVLWECLC